MRRRHLAGKRSASRLGRGRLPETDLAGPLHHQRETALGDDLHFPLLKIADRCEATAPASW
jgi:hypothetical protein